MHFFPDVVGSQAAFAPSFTLFLLNGKDIFDNISHNSLKTSNTRPAVRSYTPSMKKFILLLLMLLYTLPSPLSVAITLAEHRPAEQEIGEESYACILDENVYFYTSAQETSGVFVLPKTYYVKVLSVGERFTQVEYLTDGEHTQAIRGYCLTEKLTFVDYIPVNPYLYATFSVIYTAEDGWADDELIDKIELTCAYYGSYSMGSKEYAYVLQSGKYVYVPFPSDFRYSENTEHAERSEEFAEPTSENGNGLRIGILAVLCLLVPILAAMILQTSKRAPYDSPTDE